MPVAPLTSADPVRFEFTPADGAVSYRIYTGQPETAAAFIAEVARLRRRQRPKSRRAD